MIRLLPLLSVVSLAAEPMQPPAPPVAVKAEVLADWNERFAQTEGWVGGDGAYSVPISEDRVLWFFGDTFVGAITNGSRAGSAMVNNTVGIQSGRGAAARLAFPIRRDPSDKPMSQFLPADGKGLLWPQGGTYHNGRLVLFLAQIEHTKNGGAFGFKHVAQWLAVVSNPQDEPRTWKVTQTQLPFCRFDAERTWTFGSAVLNADGFAYVYGYDEPAKGGLGAKSLILARVPLDTLADLSAWRFLRDGDWKAWDDGFPGRTHLAGSVAAELSVHYLPTRKKYVMVYTESGLSDRIVGRFADRPEGPWSASAVLYTGPEMKADKKLFSYAGKAHAHLGTDSELVISYCVNSFDFARVVHDRTLYWPRFVKVTLR